MSSPAPLDPKPSLAVIGTGRVARTLAWLFARHKAVQSLTIVGRSHASASSAAAFAGGGARALVDVRMLDRAAGPLWILVATPDAAIASVACAVADLVALQAGDCVFHVSGALPAEVLAPCRARGAGIASVHPLLSFDDPERVVHAFAGVPCAIEGDALVVARLMLLWQAIGAAPFVLEPGRKALYHAGAVFASNYLTSVIEAALESLALAGIADDLGRELLAPLIRGATEAALARGPKAALTGPLLRGDDSVVKHHHAELDAANPPLGACYAGLTAWTAHWLGRADPLAQAK